MRQESQPLERVLLLLVSALAGAVYLNSIANGFAVDDEFIVLGNGRVHHLLRLADIWLTPYWPHLGTEFGLYRPFVIFLFAIQWAAGGGAPWLFHAINVLLHATATALVFLLLRRFVPSIAAALAAALFAVHPVHVEAVANMVGQAELVSAITVLLACLIHVSRPPGAGLSWPRRALLLCLFLLALFSKESAAVLPGLLVILDLAAGRFTLTRRSLAGYAAGMAMPLFLLAAAFAGYSLLRIEALQGMFLGHDSGPQMAFLKEHRVLNALRAFPEHLRLLFFPLQLSADYSPAVIMPVASLTPMSVLGMLLLACLVALALLLPTNPQLGLPAAWFLVTLGPVSNLLFPVGILVAERTLYLPSVAVAFLVGFAWPTLAARRSSGRNAWSVLVIGVVILALGARTWARNPVWESTSALYTSLARERPESYRAQWALASTELNLGNSARAALRYEAAYRIYPRNSELMTDYAEFLIRERRYGRAVALLEDAYRMHPQILRSASLLAWAYLVSGRNADAVRVLQHVEQIGGSRVLTMPLRAYAYEQLGLPGKSAAAWRVALREPSVSSWQSWSFLARSLAAAGRDSEALQAASSALALAAHPQDSLAVARLVNSVATGCYRRQGSGAGPAASPLVPADCDGIGNWLTLRGLQTANASQNARRGPGPGPQEEPRR